MKNKFAFILDALFVAVISFVLSLAIFNYFTPYPYSVVVSTCVSLLATILFFNRASSKSKAEKLKRAEQKQCEQLCSELNFSERANQLSIIEKALKNQNISFERKRGMIVLKDKNAVIISKFGFDRVNKADIVRTFNLINKTQTAYILAQSFDAEIVSFAERFENRIILVDGQKVFKYLTEQDAIPEYKYRQFTEKNAKGSFKNLLDKKKAKTFLGFGVGFMLLSYISPLKVYYIVCGCLFLIYALILRLFGKKLA